MALIVKDSLGLGINKTILKEKIYTDEENNTFSRQLLSEDELESIKKEELLTIEQVRSIISDNCSINTYNNVDLDILIAIDSRINYNIYLVEDNVYTYNELCISYPFQELNILPESIFIRQIVVIFENGLMEVFNDDSAKISSHDLIKIANKKITSESEINSVKKIVKTKIFIGGEKWKDFLQIRGFFRGIISVSNLQIDNGQTPEFLKPFTSITNQLCIANEFSPEVKVNSDSILEHNFHNSPNIHNETNIPNETNTPNEHEIKFIKSKILALENEILNLKVWADKYN